jgi:hypothetical protein
MTIEDAIRERHAFEERLKEFLKLTSAMSDRELEIALARLADMLQQKGDDERAAFSIRLKGEVTKLYYDLRLSRNKRPSRLQRIAVTSGHNFTGFGNVLEELVDKAIGYPLAPSGPIPDFKDSTGQAFAERVKLLAP